MRYELYLRAQKPSAELARRLREGIVTDPDLSGEANGPREICFKTGEVTVRLHPQDEAQWDEPAQEAPLGVDLGVAAGAGEALATQLVEKAFSWAKRWDLLVYDPQLGRVVKADDLETITTRIKQQSDYLTETVGLGDGPTSFVDVDRPGARLSWSARFYLLIAALLVLLAAMTHYCR